MNGRKVQKLLLVNFPKREQKEIIDTVVDDSRDVLAVETLETGRKILAYEPDLVFATVPGVSVQTMQENIDELEKNVPIVAFSDDKTSVKRALIKGCEDYVIKPFEPFEVEHKVSRYLGKKKRSRVQGIQLGPAPDLPASRLRTRKGASSKMANGHIYLIREPKPFRGFSIFKEQVGSGIECIAFTRKNPREIRRDIEGGEPKLIWLSANRSSKETCIDAKDMSKITKEIDTFLKSHSNGMVFFDGLEYLVSQTDFQTVLRLLQYVNDKIMISEDRILISLDPRAFTSQEMSLIERECVLWEM